MEIKKSLVFAVAFVVLILMNSIFVSAITGSMGNARMILYPEVNGWTNTIIEKTILVRNVNDVPINIRLEADADGKEFLEVIDKEFSLAPDEEKKAQFLVKVRKQGTYEGRINVFFTPADEEGPGVVLSSTIIVIAKKNQDYEEEEEVEEEEEESEITGEVIGEERETKKGTWFLSISTLVLLLIFIYLISLMGKKRKTKSKSKNKKNEK